METERHIIVTGADGGLGIPTVTRLLGDGWQVHAIVHGAGKIKPLEDQFAGAALSVAAADLTQEDEVRKVFAALPGLKAAVHLMGGFAGSDTIADTAAEVFDRMIQLNTRSAFLLLKAAFPLLKQNGGGAIVTVGAKPAVHPAAVNAAYAASKAAVINLTLTVAEEGRMSQVRANAIIPAVIRTAENLKWASSEKESANWTPPEDIAQVIAWLVSDDGSSVTGSLIPMYHRLHS